MTIAELRALLEPLDPNAEVYVSDGPWEGQVFAAERDPFVELEADGRVKL